jgi:hypothetical protein
MKVSLSLNRFAKAGKSPENPFSETFLVVVVSAQRRREVKGVHFVP